MIACLHAPRVGKSFCSIDPITMGILGVGALGAGGSIFSSIFGASASKQQAAAITESARIASQTALTLDDRARRDIQPFREAGVQATDVLTSLLTGDKRLDDILKESALFQFQSETGSKAINRELSARGLYGSGAGLETLARFNNQLVAEEGARIWDRYFSTATLGANAAAHMATNTSNTGRSLADIEVKSGMAAGGALADAGRSLANIGPAIARPFADLAQYQMLQPILNRYSQGGGAGRGSDPVFDAVDSVSKGSGY